MPTFSGERPAKKASTCPRRSFFSRTASSAPFTPCNWKTLFDVSSPMRIIFSTDGLPCLRSQRPHSGTLRCRRGPSTPTFRNAAERPRSGGTRSSPCPDLATVNGGRGLSTRRFGGVEGGDDGRQKARLYESHILIASSANRAFPLLS